MGWSLTSQTSPAATEKKFCCGATRVGEKKKKKKKKKKTALFSIFLLRKKAVVCPKFFSPAAPFFCFAKQNKVPNVLGNYILQPKKMQPKLQKS